MPRLYQLYLFLAVISVVTCVPPALARLHTIRLEINQYANADGSFEYLLETVHAVGPVAERSGKLIAPDGTEILMDSGMDVHRSSFAEMAATVFGTWTAIEKFDGTELIYPLSAFAPFSLDDVFSDTPTIVSPVPGSVVRPRFLLQWQNETPGTHRLVLN